MHVRTCMFVPMRIMYNKKHNCVYMIYLEDSGVTYIEESVDRVDGVEFTIRTRKMNSIGLELCMCI